MTPLRPTSIEWRGYSPTSPLSLRDEIMVARKAGAVFPGCTAWAYFMEFEDGTRVGMVAFALKYLARSRGKVRQYGDLVETLASDALCDDVIRDAVECLREQAGRSLEALARIKRVRARG